ncbi:MAG: M1 family metallopeptidase [Bacteroidia bacterium]|nr:M1 family metallopeptidase [Bacteroidia bacterium]
MNTSFIVSAFTATFFLFTPNTQYAQQLSTSDQDHVKADTIKAPPPKKKAAIYRASNTRQNDILHTKLEVAFDWKKSTMKGKATISVKPYFYSTDQLYLNAKGMEITSLNVYQVPGGKDGKPLPSAFNADVSKNQKLPSSFVYENDSLKINLGKTLSADQTYTVVVEYVAKPNELKSPGGSQAIMEDKGLYFVNPTGENPYKMPQIWTQGETQASSVWFPTIDSPNEKMTQEIFITVDQKYTTLSNGLLVSSKPGAAGTRVDHWKLNEPHAPYLAMMAIGEFKKVTDAPWKGKEISYYVEKEYEAHAKAIFGDTKEMIDFYSKRLGVDYPWAKYAQVVVRDYVSGAMENTSATLHGDFMVYQTTREMLDGKKGEGVIAHELFHQWFGDLVTCESWSNLSLNESFATYGEYLWNEYKHGRGEADAHNYQSKMGYMGSKKEKHLIRFEYDQQEDMFDAFSYNKGGQILHMLRKAVGDEAFFASLKNYLETNRYKAAEVHHLRLAFEETTGRDLNWFFNQWYLQPGRPKLKASYIHNTTKQLLELKLEQTQDLSAYPLYRLPLEVDVYMDGKVQRHHIEMVDQEQVFFLKCEKMPDLVNVDAERQLLCDMDYVKSKKEYIFQYLNGPLFEDRYEALKELEKSIGEKEVFDVFVKAATSDVLSDIRKTAIVKLEKAPEDKKQEVKATLSIIYAKDKNTTTRARALNALNKKFGTDADVLTLNEKALSEQSYAICAEALEALSKQQPALAMQKAKAFENENSKKMIFVVANMYAEQGGDQELAFFHNNLKNVSGFELMTYSGAYVKLAKRCNKPESVLQAATDLEIISKGASKFVKYACNKGVSDLLSLWEGKVNNLSKSLEVSKSSEAQFADIDKQLQEATALRDKLAAISSRMK